jgi:hypothetical protein
MSAAGSFLGSKWTEADPDESDGIRGTRDPAKPSSSRPGSSSSVEAGGSY